MAERYGFDEVVTEYADELWRKSIDMQALLYDYLTLLDKAQKLVSKPPGVNARGYVRRDWLKRRLYVYETLAEVLQIMQTEYIEELARAIRALAYELYPHVVGAVRSLRKALGQEAGDST